MNNTEFYLMLTKGEELEIVKKPAGSFQKMIELYVLTDLSEDVLERLSFVKNRVFWKEQFFSFEPKPIAKFPYKVLLDQTLEQCKEYQRSDLKKLVKSIHTAAKVFAAYLSFEAFRKDLYLKCSTPDATLHFLSNLKKEMDLPLYFHKACSYFSSAGLLDVPVVTPKAKVILSSYLSLSDQNEDCYKAMEKIARENDITCYELNELIARY